MPRCRMRILDLFAGAGGAAMGVDWTITTRELSEAVPPAFTQWIGEQFAAQTEGVAA